MHILWLKSELLHPVDKGGRIRTYQTLTHLKRRHHVTYLTLDDGTAAPDAPARAQEYCHELVRIPFAAPAKGTPAFYADLARNLLSTLPYAVAKYRSSAMREAIVSVVRERRVDLLICDFLVPSLNVPDGLGIPMVLFQHNVEAAIWRRHAEASRHPVRRAYMRGQWRRMRRWEGSECRRFDHVIAVSEQDAEDMRRDYGVAQVSAVPTGVDTDFFRPTGQRPQDASTLVFLGSMDWMPNEDGVAWFAREILPLVRARRPDVKVHVVGRNPSPAIVALGRETPALDVTGTVPDVRPWLEEAAALVVPLRVGGGTRLKIYEGMAMERAVISTTIGAEGLPVAHERELLLADGAADFAEACLRVMDDAALRTRLGAAAAARVRREFSWDAAADQFAATCESVAEGAAPAGRDVPQPRRSIAAP